MKKYRPRGKVVPLLEAMAKEPTRLWTVPEVAALLKVKPFEVMAYVKYALEHKAMHRGERGGAVVLSARPIRAGKGAAAAKKAKGWNPEDDVRIQRVDPKWKPPVMVAPRSRA